MQRQELLNNFSAEFDPQYQSASSIVEVMKGGSDLESIQHKVAGGNTTFNSNHALHILCEVINVVV